MPQGTSGITSPPTTYPIHCGFNDFESPLDRIKEDNEDCGVHFDEYAGITEAAVGQLTTFNNEGAAIFGADNQIRTDIGTLPYSSTDPQSMLVGCFFSRNMGSTIGALPTLSSIPILGDLITALKELIRAQGSPAATPVMCEFSVTILEMDDFNGQSGEARLEQLRGSNSPNQHVKTFTFIPNGIVLLGHSTTQTHVKEFDLRDPKWKAIKRVRLGRTAQDVNLGDTGIGSIGAMVDDYRAVGRL